MWVKITCSRCGNTRRISTNQPNRIRNAINAGWGSYGNALYCPNCSKTWHERNTKPMADAVNTSSIIMGVVVSAHCRKNNL